jgi:hypothetical protein
MTLDVQRQLFSQEEVFGRQPRVGTRPECDERQEVSNQGNNDAGHHEDAMIARFKIGSQGEGMNFRTARCR